MKRSEDEMERTEEVISSTAGSCIPGLCLGLRIHRPEHVSRASGITLYLDSVCVCGGDGSHFSL